MGPLFVDHLVYFIHCNQCYHVGCVVKIMYWGDGSLDKIESAYLNGSERQVLVNEIRGNSQYFGMALDDRYLYFSDWSNQTSSRFV